MPSTVTRSSALALALLAGAAGAHPQGFHKKLTFTVSRSKVALLLVMDVDGGGHCLRLREALDGDRDGRLSRPEVAQLRERLVALAWRRLEVRLSGARLPLVVGESKVSLHGDERANDASLSLALLAEVDLSSPPGEGFQLEVLDVAPDQSTIALEVFQAGAKESPAQVELRSGVRAAVRLGRLAGP